MDLVAGSNKRDVALVPVVEATLRGTVTDPDGTPIYMMVVTLLETGEYRNTDASGAYLYYPIEPGTYTVEFVHDDYVPQTQTVSISEGEDKTLDVVMTPKGTYTPNTMGDATVSRYLEGYPGYTWEDIHDGPGTHVEFETQFHIGIWHSSYEVKWERIDRAIMTFPTNDLTYGDPPIWNRTITYAALIVWCIQVRTDTSLDYSVSVYDAADAGDSPVAADYNNIDNIPLSDPVPLEHLLNRINIEGYPIKVEIPLNAYAMEQVLVAGALRGSTRLALRESHYDAPNIPSVWAPDQIIWAVFPSSRHAQWRPVLYMEFT